MTKKEQESIKLLSEFNQISPRDISDILEALLDRGYLNKNGIKLYEALWEMFIKEV